jgi:hypothetical protein
VCAFDERSRLAEAKLKEFLGGFVKRNNKNLHKLIMGMLERNSYTGDLDITNINRLYKLEKEFDDPNWKEAIVLFKESYQPSHTASYVRFYELNEAGRYENIGLQFSSM